MISKKTILLAIFLIFFRNLRSSPVVINDDFGEIYPKADIWPPLEDFEEFQERTILLILRRIIKRRAIPLHFHLLSEEPTRASTTYVDRD